MIRKLNKSGELQRKLNEGAQNQDPEIFKAVLKMNDSLEKLKREHNGRVNRARKNDTGENIVYRQAS